MGGKIMGPDCLNLHRNKRSLTLDLKSEEGKAIFFKLAESADVVVENFRSDVKTRLGIDYDAVSKINPRIVYGSISGLGQSGPDAKVPAFTRSPSAWVGSCRSPAFRGRGRFASASQLSI